MSRLHHNRTELSENVQLKHELYEEEINEINVLKITFWRAKKKKPFHHLRLHGLLIIVPIRPGMIEQLGHSMLNNRNRIGLTNFD